MRGFILTNKWKKTYCVIKIPSMTPLIYFAQVSHDLYTADVPVNFAKYVYLSI